jgi:hypothetical protein
MEEIHEFYGLSIAQGAIINSFRFVIQFDFHREDVDVLCISGSSKNISVITDGMRKLTEEYLLAWRRWWCSSFSFIQLTRVLKREELLDEIKRILVDMQPKRKNLRLMNAHDQ